MEITDEMLYKCAPEAQKLWLDSLPAVDQLPEHPFSRRFERKMKRLIREHKRTLPMRRARKAVKWTAAAAVFVAAVSFSVFFFYPKSGDVRIGAVDFDYLPAGMREFRRDIPDDAQEMTVWFQDSEGSQLKVRQQAFTESTGYMLAVNTVDATVTAVSIGGHETALIERAGITSLTWEDGLNLFVLTGEISSEEIIAIAEGMTVAEGGNE